MVPTESRFDPESAAMYVRLKRHAPVVPREQLIENFHFRSGSERRAIPGTVVLICGLSRELSPLGAVVREFGWSLEHARGLSDLRALGAQRNLVAVLLEPGVLALPWSVALESVREVAPKALPILCQRFSEIVDWPEFAAAGAFHCLSVPLDIHEMRQSLGFVWAAKHRRAGHGARLHRPAPTRRPVGRAASLLV